VAHFHVGRLAVYSDCAATEVEMPHGVEGNGLVLREVESKDLAMPWSWFLQRDAYRTCPTHGAIGNPYLPTV
jgi:hypothetical protein